MNSKKDFNCCVFADNQYSAYKEHVNIGGTDYKMFMQREISGNSDNKANTLCVNCFQFIPQDKSVNYMLCLGYDGKYGTYTFSFAKDISNMFIDMDNIVSTPQDLPIIKEYFKAHFESSLIMGPEEENTKFEDISEILNAMFDYCYDYLVEHGFHIVDIKNG